LVRRIEPEPARPEGSVGEANRGEQAAGGHANGRRSGEADVGNRSLDQRLAVGKPDDGDAIACRLEQPGDRTRLVGADRGRAAVSERRDAVEGRPGGREQGRRDGQKKHTHGEHGRDGADAAERDHRPRDRV
jgi:hypothetical protein